MGRVPYANRRRCTSKKPPSHPSGWRGHTKAVLTKRFYAVDYLAGHKSMAMTKRYDHANEERYGAAIEALDAAGTTGSAEALAGGEVEANLAS
jgi:hypothetical protein